MNFTLTVIRLFKIFPFPWLLDINTEIIHSMHRESGRGCSVKLGESSWESPSLILSVKFCTIWTSDDLSRFKGTGSNYNFTFGDVFRDMISGKFQFWKILVCPLALEDPREFYISVPQQFDSIVTIQNDSLSLLLSSNNGKKSLDRYVT